MMTGGEQCVPKRDASEGAVTLRSIVPIVLSALLSIACSAGPVQRPLEGAPSGAGAAANRPDGAAAPRLSDVPPTLSPGGQPQGGSAPSGSPRPAGSPSPSPSPLPGVAGFVIVATDGAGANLRDGPSTSARVITTLAEGTDVEVLCDPITAEGRSWRQIRGGGREGWVVAVVVRPR